MPISLDRSSPEQFVEKDRLILECKAITKAYPVPYGRLEVLKGVDLKVQKGEMVAVVGASGIGKSTLLHLLGLIDQPDAGSLKIAGEMVLELDQQKKARFRNKHIGFVFQFHHLLAEFSAVENVMVPLLMNGFRLQPALKKAYILLQEMGLVDRAQHRPAELSGGEQQRVALARALVTEPALVIADEPTGNLDRTTSEGLHILMHQTSQQKQTAFVIATHNMDLARQADRVVRLIDGKAIPVNKNDLK